MLSDIELTESKSSRQALRVSLAKRSFPLIAKPTRARALCECFHLIKINCQAMSKRVGICDEWKRVLIQNIECVMYNKKIHTKRKIECFRITANLIAKSVFN